jgi:ATP-dependent Clp protease ATP-binding subunit ClpA
VILLDEVEKAHPDVLHLFLQILEDGILTDSSGRTVDFSSTVIIMTSNLISSSEGEALKLGFSDTCAGLSNIRDHKRLKEFFRPEFLSRIDDVLLFSPLGRAELCKIADIMLNRLASNARESGHDILVDPQVCELLANITLCKAKGSGARELRRQIRELIETPLAQYILNEDKKSGTAVRISVSDEKILFGNI